MASQNETHRSIGLFVTSNKHLDKIINLCKAAKSRGVKVCIFFTHQGLLATQDPLFSQLEGLAKMSLCHAGFENLALNSPVPGIEEKDYGTQSRHIEIIKGCDRYMVL